MQLSPFTESTDRYFNQVLTSSDDYKVKKMSIEQIHYSMFYLDTMIDPDLIQDHVIRPILINPNEWIPEVVSVINITATEDLQEAAEAIITGKSVIQREGEKKLYILGTDLKKERSVNIPINERVLRGSNEAFIENLDTNINLLRKQIISTDLVVKYYTLGRISKTKVAVVYIKSIIKPEIPAELDRRLQSIDIDYVEAPGFIQELIQEKRLSVFPQLLTTERPDRTRSYLMEGKIVILAAGSPDATLLPVSFWAFFQSPDDYQMSWYLGSFFRLLRLVCFIIAIGLPGVYVAVVNFHPNLLPLHFALTLQSSLTVVTLPPLLEALSMMLLLEILREATIRLASPIAQTSGLVGGIVIGTAVVQSNLVSNTVVIVAAFTGLASFIMSSYEMSNTVRILSYPALFIADIFGLAGLMFFFLCLNIHLSRMNTMGFPYYYSTLFTKAVKDTLIRAPIGDLGTRPTEAAPTNKTRIRKPRGWKK
ncbi:spore germination protein [Paenibacillus sp. BC26]|uniref:spore germination protein n=1 Tax=Paenibacillus sp. BC26 TaxID=1881032 RepID=UPI0008E11BA9|nr:spore germination protein [Paenibacillus sp. BC26]SFS45897.1 spore germination protein KA [Paenibacillus sp. BC26]